MNAKSVLSRVVMAVAGLCAAGVVAAGDVGGHVYSSPGTIGLRLEWGSNYENSKDISVTGDGAYKFGVNIRNNTTYRVIATSAPSGWACRGKLVETYLTKAGATNTNVYCGTATSANGVRIAAWNLEWFDSADPPEKKQAIADIINQYHFDVFVASEVLDDASWNDFVVNYLGNASDWDYRIGAAGCSQQQVTMWRKSAVTFESGYDLDAATTNGIIDENSATWADCGGRRPYVATFAVNNSSLRFTTATIHFKAYTSRSDCQQRKDQVDTLVQWLDASGMSQQNFIALGDFNDPLVGTGNCASIDTLASMENHPGFFFATAQPDYDYAFMMGNGLVTEDTKSFQETIDHIWVSSSLLGSMQATDTYGDAANVVEANLYFTSFGEPDHDAPYISLAK